MKKHLLLAILIFSQLALTAQEKFQLAPPLIQYNSVFFTNKTSVEIKFKMEGSKVHYTLNGEEPAESDPVYNKPVVITQNFITLKAKSFGAAFLPSETASVIFIKNGKPVQSLNYTTPHNSYPGNGPLTLIDNLGGSLQSNSKNWMGYQCDTVNITVNLTKKQKVSSVLLHFLQNEAAWIFLPEAIWVYTDNPEKAGTLLAGSMQINSDNETAGSHLRYQLINAAKKIKTRHLYITLLVKKKIPAWHVAKDQHAWMFIDELKIY